MWVEGMMPIVEKENEEVFVMVIVVFCHSHSARCSSNRVTVFN